MDAVHVNLLGRIGELAAKPLDTRISKPLTQVEGRSRRLIGVKLAAAYEGKEEVATGRRRSAERQVTAVVGPGALLWEHTLTETGRKWDLSAVRTVRGNGAPWVKLDVDHSQGRCTGWTTA